MEYRGVEFCVVRAIQRQRWKWTVALNHVGTKTGVSESRIDAIADAQRAIV